MKTVADTDLQRLEDLIINGQKAIETRFTAIETRFTAIENSIVEIKADIGEIKADIKEIKQDVKSLEIGQAKLTERVEGMDNRLKIVEGSQKNQIKSNLGIDNHFRRFTDYRFRRFADRYFTLCLV